MSTTVLPLLLFAACAVLLALAMLFVGRVFGPRRKTAVKQMPYESGMDPIHDARRRFDVRFHLVAIAFLVFDVELLFLYPWAVASHPRVEPAKAASARNADTTAAGLETYISAANPKSKIQNPKYSLGIDAAVRQHLVSSRELVFAEAMVFIGLLGVGYLYAWRKGVFRWG
jgi:NADH-quinone oxidoreductase subunit A